MKFSADVDQVMKSTRENAKLFQRGNAKVERSKGFDVSELMYQKGHLLNAKHVGRGRRHLTLQSRMYESLVHATSAEFEARHPIIRIPLSRKNNDSLREPDQI